MNKNKTIDVVHEMTEDEEEKIESCIISHLEHIKNEILNEINMSEESYVTTKSKYWNYHWVNEDEFDNEQIDELINATYFHCLMCH